ncbi:hypothetical protein CAEBREN_08900 [Caenorhabditis brenneri]|uniref:C-type lectin domain-containing protein n=1 Tax=Caenorhabditis brenneri TaxID=135651 RepID=G0MJT2_CAEBE|nr:hypothetical protein CAEBREN_08900 [Caenorhabditis brenneri]
MSIGKILNVKSYPMTGIEEEYNDVKDRLTRHRFHLTNAFKDDGCKKADFVQWNMDGTNFQLYKTGKNDDANYCNAHSFSFHSKDRYPTMAAMRAPLLCALRKFYLQNSVLSSFSGPLGKSLFKKSGIWTVRTSNCTKLERMMMPIIAMLTVFLSIHRYPTMAGMRAPLLCALHTFNRVYQDCPPGPPWSEPPVQFKRTHGRVFCHYVNNKDVKTRDEAINICEGIDAALTGFDSADEFEAVRKSVNPQYPPGSKVIANGGLPQKFWGPENVLQIDDHYWLGGKSPCDNACDDEKFNKRHEASWANGVAVNNDFLNHGNHEGAAWEEQKEVQYVSFRRDKSAFHIHPKNVPYKKMFYICGKSSDLKPAERQKGGLGSGRI